jgi:agmatine deiminase
MTGQTTSPWRMPAEWERHEATWLAWPHEETDWPGKFEPIAWVYANIVKHLAAVEKVRILVQDAAAEAEARDTLQKAGTPLDAVEFFQVATDRSWTRDFCPIFVKDAENRKWALNWRFNGWAKYGNSEHDDAATCALAGHLGWPVRTPEWNGQRVVLEGGSIDLNGAGTILTTEECLLSDVQQRNPGLDRAAYESIFQEYLGASRTLWLRNGIAGDDTHGHVDDLARFTDARTVVIAHEDDPSEDNFGPLDENLRLLREMRDQNNQLLRVAKLPMPQPIFFDGQRLPASYANFYIANEVVLVPVFNDPNDRVALNKLAELFPHRRIIGIGCLDLVLGLGTLHCMTQQEPA